MTKLLATYLDIAISLFTGLVATSVIDLERGYSRYSAAGRARAKRVEIAVGSWAIPTLALAAFSAVAANMILTLVVQGVLPQLGQAGDAIQQLGALIGFVLGAFVGVIWAVRAAGREELLRLPRRAALWLFAERPLMVQTFPWFAAFEIGVRLASIGYAWGLGTLYRSIAAMIVGQPTP